MLFGKWSKRSLRPLTLVLAVLSFAACIYYTKVDRSASFYWLPTRMWELLLGAGLALYRTEFCEMANRWFKTKFLTTLLHSTGLLLILGSYIWVENNEHFPGALPLMPCLGTVLLIAPLTKRSFVWDFLSTKPVLYIGKISYSLYLWHWPLIVYGKFSGMPNSIVIPSMIVASIFSYHFIETPARNAKGISLKWVAGSAIPVAAVLYLTFAFPQSPLLWKLGNFEDPITLTKGKGYDRGPLMSSKDLDVSSYKQGPTIVVTGSSHAMHFCDPIEKFSKQYQYQFVTLSTSGIGITSVPTKEEPSYRGMDLAIVRENRLRLLEQLKPEVLIVAGRWGAERNKTEKLVRANREYPNFRELMTKELSALSKLATKVIVIGQVPHPKLPKNYNRELRKYLVANYLRGHTPELTPEATVITANRELDECIKTMGLNNVSFVNPHTHFVDSKGKVEVFEDGKFYYADDNHLNQLGAEKVFEELLRLPIEQHFKLRGVAAIRSDK